MRINISYSSKNYGSQNGYSSYTLKYSRYSNGMYISILPEKTILGPRTSARISFNSDIEALNFAHSIISMIHLKQKELKINVKKGIPVNIVE